MDWVTKSFFIARYHERASNLQHLWKNIHLKLPCIPYGYDLSVRKKIRWTKTLPKQISYTKKIACFSILGPAADGFGYGLWSVKEVATLDAQHGNKWFNGKSIGSFDFQVLPIINDYSVVYSFCYRSKYTKWKTWTYWSSHCGGHAHMSSHAPLSFCCSLW